MKSAPLPSYVNGKLVIPPGYRPLLNLRETERAIKFIKDFFQEHLAAALNLSRVSAPLFVRSGTGINDHLNDVEKPIRFTVRDGRVPAEIVQSLAKWKREALANYGFKPGEGLYTDMNAIRPDEPALDNLHSVYVDQWDWERVMTRGQRSVDFLKEIVRKIYGVLLQTDQAVRRKYPRLPALDLPPDIHFVHSRELEEQYPHLAPREREQAACRVWGAVFVIGIGAPLKNGELHDGRAADYDDWSTPGKDGRPGLNGDILVWNPVLQRAFELSSMGIRVDARALRFQLRQRGKLERLKLYFHRRLMQGKLPLTIGGGLGQSRLCMLFLRKAHVGEVQASVWPPAMAECCKKHGLPLL